MSVCMYTFIYTNICMCIYIYTYVGVPFMEVPQNGWFIRKNPIKIDGLGIP